MRTLCYTCKLIGSLTQDQTIRRKLLKFGAIMSKTRATLRLFDDLPMLKFNLDYGLGENVSYNVNF